METSSLVNTVLKAVEPKAAPVNQVPEKGSEPEVVELEQPASAGQVLPQELVEPDYTDIDVIEEKISELNSFVQNIQRGIQFTVDEETGHSVITVTDRDTGDVIRTFPSEEMLAIAAHLNESLALQDEAGRGLLVNAKA